MSQRPPLIGADDFLSVCASSFEFDVGLCVVNGIPKKIAEAKYWKKEGGKTILVLREPDVAGCEIRLDCGRLAISRIGFNRNTGRVIIDMEEKK